MTTEQPEPLTDEQIAWLDDTVAVPWWPIYDAGAYSKLRLVMGEVHRLRAALAEAEREAGIDMLLRRIDAAAWPYILITFCKQDLEYEVEIEVSGRPNGVAISRKAGTFADALRAVTSRIEERDIFQSPE